MIYFKTSPFAKLQDAPFVQKTLFYQIAQSKGGPLITFTWILAWVVFISFVSLPLHLAANESDNQKAVDVVAPEDSLPSNPEELFKSAIEFYQKKDFVKALELFEKSAAKSQTAVVYTNAALASYQLGQKGKALGYLRKAQSLDPQFSTAQEAYSFIQSQFKVKEIPRKIRFIDELQATLISSVSFWYYFILFLIFTFLFIWNSLSHWGKIRVWRSDRVLTEDDQREFPKFWKSKNILIFIMLILSTALFALKKRDSQYPFATVIVEKSTATAAPGKNQAVLFDLYEGMEVRILREHEGYYQVQYPGAIVGWVVAQDLILH